MSTSISITLLATSLIIASKSSAGAVAFLDIEVIRETDKAILVEFKNIEELPTGKTEWLPKKALIPSKIIGQDVYTVADWFNERIDHDQLNHYFDLFGYMANIDGTDDHAKEPF